MAQTKSGSVSDAISQAIQNENTLPAEFHKILQVMENIEIQRQNKAKVRQITKEEREELLEHGKRKGRKIFYKKLQLLSVPRVTMSFKA